jgi:hypothetical protein
MMISAVLDACVLYSASLRDFLLRLAADKLFAPLWSEDIQNEWTRSLLRKRSNVDPHAFIDIVARHRAVLKQPSKTVGEYLVTLEKQGLLKTVAFLREHESDI